MEKQLSILIPTLPARIDKLHRLVSHINEQVITGGFENEVQLLIDGDSKEITIGAKRNRLLSNAIGKYTVFIDEDDLIASNYIALILKAIEKQKDVICFNGEYISTSQPPKKIIYNMNVRHNYENADTYFRQPNHICCFKREIITRVPFKEINFGEDDAFGQEIVKHINNQCYIDEKLYFYIFDMATSQTHPTNKLVTAFKE